MSFTKGQSGNPQGRPRGAISRLTVAVREQIAAGADPIAFLQQIMAGDLIDGAEGPGGEREKIAPTLEQRIRAAIKLADKLCPDAKDNAVKFEVPKIAGLEDALAAMAKVADAMNAGELTPGEALAVMNVISQYAKAYETTDIDRRIRELEEARK